MKTYGTRRNLHESGIRTRLHVCFSERETAGAGGEIRIGDPNPNVDRGEVTPVSSTILRVLRRRQRPGKLVFCALQIRLSLIQRPDRRAAIAADARLSSAIARAVGPSDGTRIDSTWDTAR
jgi:hypothetical protein